ELVGEDVVLQLVPVLVLIGLDPEQLLLVVPLVESLRLVEPLIALQADQPPIPHTGQRFRKFGLSDACRTLDENRLAEPLRQEGHLGDAVVGEVVDRSEGFGQRGRRIDAGNSGGHTLGTGKRQSRWSSASPSQVYPDR